MQMTDVTKKKIRGELLDELLTGVKTQEDMFGKGGLVSALTGQLIERMLSAELGLHLKDEAQRQEVSLQTGESTAFDEAEESLATKKNRRNGTSRKSLESSHGPVTIAVPRDRQSTFEPIIVPKHLRRIAGFDDKVLALYSRGLSTRDISETLQDLYGTEVSAELISQVTEAVHEELVAWQNRPLEASYAVIWMDAIFIKIRDQGVVQNKALHLAIGLTLDGKKHVIGFWLEATEGAKFWQRVLGEWQTRGLRDVLIMCCDGLKGLPQAIATMFPHTIVQGCIVHQVRHCLSFVSWQDRKAVVRDMRNIYCAPTEDAARVALEAFGEAWNPRYPMIHASWLRNWATLRPFYEFAPALRKLVYTTNMIESVNACIRRAVTAKGHFTSDAAALKMVYLTLRNLGRRWEKTPPVYWKQSYGQLVLRFGDRAIPNATSSSNINITQSGNQ